MNLLEQNLPKVAVASVISSAIFLLLGGKLVNAESAVDLPEPPVGLYAVQNGVKNAALPDAGVYSGNKERSDVLKAPQQLETEKVGDLSSMNAPKAPLAPNFPKKETLIIPASEALSQKNMPTKPSQPIQPKGIALSPPENKAGLVVPTAPKLTVTSPVAPSAPESSAEPAKSTVINVQIPVAPQKPNMQMPAMVPDMQMKIRRPVMEPNTMPVPAMVMPPLPPEHETTQPQAPIPLAPVEFMPEPSMIEAMPAPPTPPSFVEATPQQAVEKDQK